MGWFSFFDAFTEIVEEFSSPSGDGLVRFLPLRDFSTLLCFRPRLGMGWFLCRNYLLKKLLQFSSPSGDGLVLKSWTTYALAEKFSSPLGDGLVPYGFAWCWWSENFRPPWEWIGSMLSKSRTPALQSFRPRLGMGWFHMDFMYVWRNHCFRPRVGMGWFLQISCNDWRLK